MMLGQDVRHAATEEAVDFPLCDISFFVEFFILAQFLRGRRLATIHLKKDGISNSSFLHYE